jgi:hypothetical protein
VSAALSSPSSDTSGDIFEFFFFSASLDSMDLANSSDDAFANGFSRTTSALARTADFCCAISGGFSGYGGDAFGATDSGISGDTFSYVTGVTTSFDGLKASVFKVVTNSSR